LVAMVVFPLAGRPTMTMYNFVSFMTRAHSMDNCFLVSLKKFLGRDTQRKRTHASPL
jgi:hypothetical protein